MSGRRRIAIGLCIYWAVCCLWPLIVRAEDAPADLDELSPHPPIVEINFNLTEQPHGFVYNEDGTKLLVNLGRYAVNVWEIGVYYWPEILGALTGVILLLAAYLIVVFVRRRPRIVGMPYCRHCNYCVHSITGAKCPECGRSIDRPVIGKPIPRRVIPVASFAMFVSLAYGLLWAFDVPRTGQASDYFGWWVYGVQDAALTGRPPWIMKHLRRVHSIIEYDVTTRKPLRTFLTLPDDSYRLLERNRSGDGMFVHAGSTKELILLSTSTGRVLHWLDLPKQLPMRTFEWDHWVGTSPSGELAYFTIIDTEAQTHLLLEWHIPSGGLRTVLEGGAYSEEGQWSASWFAVARYRVIGEDTPILIEWPSPVIDLRSDAVCKLRDPQKPDQPIELSSFPYHEFIAIQNPADLRTSYIAGYRDRFELAHLDLETYRFETLTTFPVGLRPTFHVGFAETAINDQYLILNAVWNKRETRMFFSSASDQPRVFAIFNLQDRSWQGLFTVPEAWRQIYTRIAPDNQSFTAYGLNRSAQPGQNMSQLLIYDLTTLPHDVNWQFD